jgi:signal transduction histidine kinase/PAS domain-containing protein
MKASKLFVFAILFMHFSSFAQVQEQKVKAAFIYYFGQYVNWPNESKIDTFTIITFSDNVPFQQEMDLIQQNYRIKSRPIKVLPASSQRDLSQCQIVFFSNNYCDSIPSYLNRFSLDNLLVVTDNCNNSILSMINIRPNTKDKTLGYKVYKDNLEAKGFTFHADLLVHGGSLMDVKELYLKTFAQLSTEMEKVQSMQKELADIEAEKQLIEEQYHKLQSSLDSLRVLISSREERLSDLAKGVEEKDSMLLAASKLIEAQQLQSKQLKEELFLREKNKRRIGYELEVLNQQKEQKQKEIQQLQEDLDKRQELINVQSEKITDQRNILLMMIVAGFILAGLLIGILFAFWSKKRINQKLEHLVNIRTKALKTSQEYFQSMFENSPVSVWELDFSLFREYLLEQVDKNPGFIKTNNKSFSQIEEGYSLIKLIDVNRHSLEIFECREKSIFLEDFRKVLSNSEIAFKQKLYRAIIDAEPVLETENLTKNLKGKEMYTIFKWVVLPGHEKEFNRVLLSVLDVTDMKRYEAELIQHRDNLESLVIERTREINQLNRELSVSNDILKETNKDLINKNQTLKIQQEEISSLNTELLTINEQLNEQKKQLEKAFRELSNTQEKLIQSEKMASLGMLTAGVAHEINNPLNFISAGHQALEQISEEFYSQFSEEPGISNTIKKSAEEWIQDIKEINQSVAEGIDRSVAIINSLKLYSRDSGDKKVMYSLESAVESTLVILKHRIKDSINVLFEFDGIPEIMCIPGKINQVLMNIISNAIDAVEDKGKITISTKHVPAEGKVSVTIKDNGVGIDEMVLGSIFDPFFTTKGVGKGTGLGLYISYGIIEMHNGKISVESEKGKGTIFTLSFPIK